jgi:uncharacterized protein (DUF433 family)
MSLEELRKRVVTDRKVCGGMAVIRGTRIPIAIILDSLAANVPESEILAAYPHLTPEDIRAAIAYAAELSRETVWQLTG